MMDCLMGALAQALPDRVPADGSGGSTLPTIGGRHEGRPFIFVETIMGAWCPGSVPVETEAPIWRPARLR
jgi:N-methylhydantoinase B